VVRRTRTAGVNPLPVWGATCARSLVSGDFLDEGEVTEREPVGWVAVVSGEPASAAESSASCGRLPSGDEIVSPGVGSVMTGDRSGRTRVVASSPPDVPARFRGSTLPAVWSAPVGGSAVGWVDPVTDGESTSSIGQWSGWERRSRTGREGALLGGVP